MSVNIQKVAIIGAGQMGAGIAQVFASAKKNVLLIDTNNIALEKALSGIQKSLKKFVEKGITTEKDAQATLARISTNSNFSSITNEQLLIEAIIENTSLKQELFSKLDAASIPEAILASNTSSISITKLAAATNRPAQVIGMHFMNPVPIMKLVEVVCGLQTSEAVVQNIVEVTKSLEKTPVIARRDTPGFIVNRILVPLINEAIFALHEKLATAEDIDTAMKLGANHPMGPLELADFIGLDTVLSILQIFHTELGEDKYRPCPLLVKYVEAGLLGRKTSRGFYSYE